MQYLSTRNNSLKESFSKILLQGLSKDGGLFLPHIWPLIDVEQLKNQTYQDIAFQIIFPFVPRSICQKLRWLGQTGLLTQEELKVDPRYASSATSSTVNSESPP